MKRNFWEGSHKDLGVITKEAVESWYWTDLGIYGHWSNVLHLSLTFTELLEKTWVLYRDDFSRFLLSRLL